MLQESERKAVLRLHDSGTTRKEIYFLVFMARYPSLDLRWENKDGRLDVIDDCYKGVKSDVDAFLEFYATDSSRT